MDAARCAGKNAATNMTMVMPANAPRIVSGSLELNPYSIERKVVATARDDVNGEYNVRGFQRQTQGSLVHDGRRLMKPKWIALNSRPISQERRMSFS